MDEYKSKSYRVMAAYNFGLWDDQGYPVNPDDEEINAPFEYVKRFEAWLDKSWDNLDGTLDLDSFNKEGRALAVELKKIVGTDIEVTYWYTTPHPIDGEGYSTGDIEEIS